jgi:HK97 family phage prohead protease
MNLENDTFELEIRNSEPIEATLSTDTPVQMGDNEEVLLHSPENIEFHTARLPLLLNHDPAEQIGIVEGLRIMGNKLMGKIRLASDDKAQEIYQDIRDGIRENLSIGYQVLKAHFDDMGRKIVTKYRVMEVSLVPIPADQNAGIGRSIQCVQENDNFFILHIPNQVLICRDVLLKKESRKLFLFQYFSLYEIVVFHSFYFPFGKFE